MPASFAQKNIVVTGGFSGIGLAVVKALSRCGATVFVIDFGKSSPEELNQAPNVHCLPGCDISDMATCETCLNSVPGRLDALVNCAGVAPFEGKLASQEAYQRIVSTNITGTWNMGVGTIQRMSQQEKAVCAASDSLFTGTEKQVGQGCIINISSGGGLKGIPGSAVYCASKHAVLGLVRTWARDWPSIRINAVCPGITDTPLIRGPGPQTDGPPAWAKAAEARIPMGRLAQPTDIADAVLFLLSDAASYITGQTLVVNGGID